MKRIYQLLASKVIFIVMLICLVGCERCDTCKCPEDCIDPKCNCNCPPNDLWTSVKEFSSLLWPNNLIMTDSLNIWMTAVAIPDLNPVPDLPITIYRSSDAGKTWTTGTIPGTNKLFSYQFSAINGNTAWVSVKSQGLYKTSDGGLSWTLINSSQKFKDNNVGLHFFDQNTGIARYFHDEKGIINDSVIFMRTANGGTTWNKVNCINSSIWLAGEFSAYLPNGVWQAIGDTIAFPTNFGRVFYSYDRGITWSYVSYGSGQYEDFSSLAMISSKIFALSSLGYYQSPNDTVFHSYGKAKIISTSDKGQTWNNPVFLNIPISELTAIPKSHGEYIASWYHYTNNSSGTIFMSSDGGKTFTDIDTLQTNLGIAVFYSIHHGFGASFNYNDTRFPSRMNYIYKWDPDRLYRKKILR